MSSYTDSTWIPGIVSICFSGSVILTSILFPQMRRRKIFMEVISLISVCDIMGNWPYVVLGYPSKGSALCGFESFCNLFFFPVSWMLTAVLAYCLKSLIISGSLLPRSVIYGVCVTIPLLIALLILTTNSYGNGHRDKVCTISGNRENKFIWHTVGYDGLFLCCATLILYWLFQVIRLERAVDGYKLSDQPTFQVVKSALILYPLFLVICWLPHVALSLVYYHHHTETIYNVFVGMKIMNGATTAIIFFTHSREARIRWSKLLRLHYLKWDVCCIQAKPPMSESASVDGSKGSTVELTDDDQYVDFQTDDVLVEDISRESVAFFRSSMLSNASPHNVHPSSEANSSSYNSSIIRKTGSTVRMSEMVSVSIKRVFTRSPQSSTTSKETNVSESSATDHTVGSHMC